MDPQSKKKATRHQKIKLFSALLSLLPALKANDRQAAQLILIRILYLVFGFENQVIDKEGTIYSVFDKKELMSLFTAATRDHGAGKSLFRTYPDFLPEAYSPENDIDIGIRVFEELKVRGLDFKSSAQKRQKLIDTDQLSRADKLIDSLRKMLEEDQIKAYFAEERAILHNMNLPRIQEQIRAQILQNKIDELAPDNILIAYYKVYHKLP